ncbi:hypothetical protein JKP88DRAFT_287126 [Tribonema minus]|uniref:Uncharacterized protein n=1 Tax=Tribonema minus TaxID=303371 RepID=A0A835Z9D4_9STRA|nr:hypothetical protein JKP88DRAFT_287126 [Tribonema minus]
MQRLHGMVISAEEARLSNEGRMELKSMAALIRYLFENQSSSFVKEYYCRIISQRGRNAVQSFLQGLAHQNWALLRICKRLIDLREAGCGDDALRTLRDELLKDDEAYSIVMSGLENRHSGSLLLTLQPVLDAQTLRFASQEVARPTKRVIARDIGTDDNFELKPLCGSLARLDTTLTSKAASSGPEQNLLGLCAQSPVYRGQHQNDVIICNIRLVSGLCGLALPLFVLHYVPSGYRYDGATTEADVPAEVVAPLCVSRLSGARRRHRRSCQWERKLRHHGVLQQQRRRRGAAVRGGPRRHRRHTSSTCRDWHGA